MTQNESIGYQPIIFHMLLHSFFSGIGLLLFCLLSLVPATVSAEEKDLSSRTGYIGSGYSDTPKSCAETELRWMQSAFDDPPSAYVRKRGEIDLMLGKGMAAISPNCKHFWFVYNGDESGLPPHITIFAMNSGPSAPLPGKDPVWLASSNEIAFLRGPSRELMIYSVETATTRSIYKPLDAQPCVLFGDGVDWRPPKIISPTRIEFSYPTKPMQQKTGAVAEDSGMKPGLTVLVDIKSGAVVKTSPAEVQCDYVTTDPTHRAKKLGIKKQS